MTYCLNSDCPAPGDQKTSDPQQAKFCSNCGAKLLLNDRYRALKAIGQGGFGRTFLAVDELKPSRPSCVIKQFFRQQTAESPEKAAELFQKEAVRLDELGHHPQIPMLFAYFEQDGQKYLVQEFIKGQSLDQALQEKGAFSEEQVRRLLVDLLPVLQYIHANQVIHRDIKPENIIQQEGDSHFVLVDFGASKFASSADLAKPGTKIGSQGYIAPEQALGKVTFNSDLYSVGATCVHLLTNLLPAKLLGQPEQSGIWKQHVKTPISKSLERILDKLLLQDVQKRYQLAAEVLQDLEMLDLEASLRRSPTWDIESVGTVPSLSAKRPNANATVSPKSLWECVFTLKGHESWVRSVAFSPDGATLASGSGDKTVKLWSVKTGELLQTLDGHTSWVRAIAISPDGKTLATVENDKGVLLWDFNPAKHRTTLTGHLDWVRSVVFSADGQILVTGSQDKTAILWDLASGTPIQTLKGHAHWVVATAISPDGQAVVTGSRDQMIRFWSRATGKCLASLSGHSAEVLAVAISPNGKLLASSSSDNTAMLWKLSNGKHLHTFTAHDNAVNAVAFSPDGKILATSSNDQTIKLWRIDNGELMSTLSGHEGWVWSVAFSADGQTLASSSWDGVIKLWKRSPSAEL